MPSRSRIPAPPKGAKKRVRAIRQQVAEAKSKFRVTLPALLTLGESAAAIRVSKPTFVRILGRGEIRVYRPNGQGGVVLVYADSLAEHVERNSTGGAR